MQVQQDLLQLLWCGLEKSESEDRETFCTSNQLQNNGRYNLPSISMQQIHVEIMPYQAQTGK